MRRRESKDVSIQRGENITICAGDNMINVEYNHDGEVTVISTGMMKFKVLSDGSGYLVIK